MIGLLVVAAIMALPTGWIFSAHGSPLETSGNNAVTPDDLGVTASNETCVGTGSGSALTTNLGAVAEGSAIYGTVYLGANTDTATVAYSAGTYHGTTTVITTVTNGDWGGWYYAANLSATSSLELYINSTGVTEMGFAGVVLSAATPGAAVLYDTSGSVGTTTLTQFQATVTTTHSPDWVGMGFTDNDGSANVGVGAGESDLGECNVPAQEIYIGVIEKTNPVSFEGGVTLFGNVTNYGGAVASGFYETASAPEGSTCGGSGSSDSVSASPVTLAEGSAVYATVWLGSGTATVSYVGGTFHGVLTEITSATGANWQGWYYADDLPATSSLVLTANTSSPTEMGISAYVIAPTASNASVLYDGSGSLGSETQTQGIATVTTSHPPEWVGMGYSDDDGVADVGVGAGETILSDCNVPTYEIYMGIIEKTNPVDFSGGVSVYANVSNYINSVASAFYQSEPGPLTLTSFSAAPASITLGASTTLSVAATGGTLPYYYAYAGLPSGCTSLNASQLTCTPTGLGNFTVRAWVNDSTGGSVTQTTVLAVTVGGTTCGGSGSSPSVTILPGATSAGSAVLATVWLGSGTATVAYEGGTFHGLLTKITSATGANWQGWYYADDLPATSSLVLQANTTSATEIGASATILTPTVTGAQVLYDGSGPIGNETQTQGIATVNTTTPPEWVGMGYSDDDGSADAEVGPGETILSDCNVPTFEVYLGIIEKSQPVDFAGGVSVYVNVTNYVNTVATAFYQTGAEAGFSIQSFTATPSAISPGGTANFSVTASGGAPPYTYTYSGLPSGCSSADTSFILCTVQQAGTYTVTVTVTDAAGRTATASASLQVTAPSAPSAALVASPSSLDLKQTTVFQALVTGGTLPYASYVYSGLPPGCSTADALNLSCTPTEPGQYTVTFTVTDAAGLTATAQTDLTVYSPIALTLKAPVGQITAGVTETFTASRTGGATGAVTYAWTFGDGGTASGATVTHAYVAPGSYTVQVVATDATGAKASTSLAVTVAAKPSSGASPTFLGLPGEWGYLVIAGLLGVVVVIAVVAGRKSRPPTDLGPSQTPLASYVIPRSSPTPNPPMPGGPRPPWDDDDPLGDLM